MVTGPPQDELHSGPAEAIFTEKQRPLRGSEPETSKTSAPTKVDPSQGRTFSHLLLEDVLLLEICSGSARLTKTARKFGLRGLAGQIQVSLLWC